MFPRISAGLGTIRSEATGGVRRAGNVPLLGTVFHQAAVYNFLSASKTPGFSDGHLATFGLVEVSHFAIDRL